MWFITKFIFNIIKKINIDQIFLNKIKISILIYFLKKFYICLRFKFLDNLVVELKVFIIISYKNLFYA